MRVIAGYLGGRLFDAPKGHRTHPMSERIRAAIFNSLGDISHQAVLDAFAGSGALGIEALSRGAESAVLVEKDMAASTVIRHNITLLGLEDVTKVIRANVSSWSTNNPDERFDIIFADPPYDRLQLPTITRLVTHLSPNGRLVLSWPGKQAAPMISGLTIAKEKDYGDSQVIFYSVA